MENLIEELDDVVCSGVSAKDLYLTLDDIVKKSNDPNKDKLSLLLYDLNEKYTKYYEPIIEEHNDTITTAKGAIIALQQGMRDYKKKIAQLETVNNNLQKSLQKLQDDIKTDDYGDEEGFEPMEIVEPYETMVQEIIQQKVYIEQDFNMLQNEKSTVGSAASPDVQKHNDDVLNRVIRGFALIFPILDSMYKDYTMRRVNLTDEDYFNLDQVITVLGYFKRSEQVLKQLLPANRIDSRFKKIYERVRELDSKFRAMTKHEDVELSGDMDFSTCLKCGKLTLSLNTTRYTKEI